VADLATKKEKGKKMYKLATPGSDTHHKQIALLLQCYDDLGIHREACGNKDEEVGGIP
jgi:hypothetical protein